MEPDRLYDVPGAPQRPRRSGQAVGQRSEPVLLATVDVDHVGPAQPADEPSEIAHVTCRLHAGGEAERLDPARAGLAGPLDDAALGSALADQRHVVPRPLELRADAGRPVRVRRPPATRHELEDSHAGAPGALSAARATALRYTASTWAA